ncbi:MAG: prolipoprotein diacylglyceryl transferase [Thermoflexales bacterium]
MDSRVALDLGIVKIYWYGIVVTLGMLVATYVASVELRRRRLDPNVAWDGALWVIGLGLVGARLYHVFSSPNDGSNSGWAYYSQNPLQIVAVWNGGLGIYGGIIGGIIGVLIVARRYRVPLWKLADSVVPGLAIGQAVGRWGNYFNQELYGGPTGSTWWGITIDPAHRIRTPSADFTDLTRYPPDTRFHPTFLYESLWNAVGFVGLMTIARRLAGRLHDGDVAGLYFIWYGVGRSWIELLFRPDAWRIGNAVPTAVVISAVGVAFGVALIALNHVKDKPAPAPAPGQ